jgi:hypothetical protein
MENLPIYITIVFFAATALTIYFFVKALGSPVKVVPIIAVWLGINALLALNGFYLETTTVPPRLVVMIVPPIIAIILLFTTKAGKQFIDKIDLATLTLMNVIRIPIEMVLFWVAMNKGIPELMTFEGRNFDVFSGITAPLVYYFGFRKSLLSPKLMITWNIICLTLVMLVVIQGILSAPTAFQQLAFDQPNIAILYFPFVWLPCFIVPAVIFSHIVSIRRLIKQKTTLVNFSV